MRKSVMTLVALALGTTAAAVLPAGAALAPATAPAAPPPPLPGEAQAARRIDRGTLEAPVKFLADDLLEGRGPATRGDKLSRLYLASLLEGMGYEPGGPGGSWEQPCELVGVKAKMPDAWSFRAGGKTVDLRRWDDYIATSGVQREKAAIEGAELVFVGYGIQAPEYRWDDYKGADLKGKVLVMMNNDPDWDPNLFAGKPRLYYGRWTYKYESAARQGAAGAITLHAPTPAAYPLRS